MFWVVAQSLNTYYTNNKQLHEAFNETLFCCTLSYALTKIQLFSILLLFVKNNENNLYELTANASKIFCVMHLLVRLLGVFLTRRKFVLTVARYDIGNNTIIFPKGNNKIFSPDKYPDYLSRLCNGIGWLIKFGRFVNDLKSTSKSFLISDDTREYSRSVVI